MHVTKKFILIHAGKPDISCGQFFFLFLNSHNYPKNKNAGSLLMSSSGHNLRWLAFWVQHQSVFWTSNEFGLGARTSLINKWMPVHTEIGLFFQA